MNFAAVLERIKTELDAKGFPVALIGGFGLAALGITRATLDLDLLVSFEAQPTVVALMTELGYETLHLSPGYSNHLHSDEALGRVDFVYVRGDTNTRIFAAARQVEGFGGVSVLVPRPEHLAAMKVHAMKNDPERRLQDLADIGKLLALPGVDAEEVPRRSNATECYASGVTLNRTAASIDLERDLPTTSEDSLVLSRLRVRSGLRPLDELQRLVDSLPAAARRQRRTTAAGWPEFEL